MATVSELGLNVMRLRKARNWTHEELSRRAGVSLSSLKRVQRGAQQGLATDAVVRLAEAFTVPVGELTGQPSVPAAEATAGALRDLRDMILSPVFLPGMAALVVADGEPRELAALEADVSAAWARYWRGDLDEMVRALPGLIAEGLVVARELGAAAAAKPLAQAWELAGTAMVNYGREDVAGIALERAVHAAVAGPDEVLTATVTGTASWVMLHQARYREAEAVALAAADQLAPTRRGALPVELAGYGNLLMCAIAPRVALGGDPVDLLDEARGVAGQLGRKTPVYQTAFGPTTVAMQGAYGYAMLKRPGDALRMAKDVEIGQLTGISRGRHYLDLGQSLVDAGRYPSALKVLRAAADIAPEWFGHQMIARSLVQQIREEQSRISDDLAGLAVLARVDTAEPAVSLVI